VWVKLDDHIDEHPKLGRAKGRIGDSALAAFVSALAYCNRNKTGGYIPVAAVRGMTMHRRPEVVADTLVDVGLWEAADGGYAIHDYDVFQPSKEKLLERRRSNAESMAARRLREQDVSSTHSIGEHLGEHTSPGTGVVPTTGSEDGEGTDSVSRARSLVVRGLFDYWREQCNHSAARLTGERRRGITSRLADGYTEAEIRSAIDGAAVGAFEKDGRRFDDIELICRNGSKLESFIGRTGAPVDLTAARRRAAFRKAIGEPA
jgi:hypothetical protein